MSEPTDPRTTGAFQPGGAKPIDPKAAGAFNPGGAKPIDPISSGALNVAGAKPIDAKAAGAFSPGGNPHPLEEHFERSVPRHPLGRGIPADHPAIAGED